MATFEVTDKDGTVYEIDGPDDMTEAQALAAFNKQRGATAKPDAPTKSAASAPPAAQKGREWSDVPLEAVSNIPSSLAHNAEALVQPILHPIDTVKNLGMLGMGLIAKFLPGKYDAEKYADALGQMMVERYGSEEGWKKTLATDPVGVLADLSMFLTGGATAAAKVPMLAGAAGKVAKVGQAIDPLTMTARGATKAGRGIMEGIGDAGTWTGGESMRQAYRAGKEGETSFKTNMRGDAPLKDALAPIKDALDLKAAERGREYNAGMASTRADTTVLDFKPIDAALRAKADVGKFHALTTARSTDETFSKLANIVDEWRVADPAIYHTAEGLDALKRAIGDLRDSTPFGTPSRNMVDGVYRAVRKEIVKQDPKYGKTMENYAKASDELNEITGTLSLGEKSRADTALRKLQSVMRNNVHSNQGHRLDVLQDLEKTSGTNLMAPLAGQAMRPWMPRGLGKLELGALAASSVAHPGLLLAAPFMSPRLMGEATYAAGATGREMARIRDALGISAENAGRLSRNNMLLGRFNEGQDNYQPYADPEAQAIDAAENRSPQSVADEADRRLAELAKTRATEPPAEGSAEADGYADGGAVTTGGDFAGDLGVHVVEMKHGGPVNPSRPSPRPQLTREQLMEAIKALAASGVLPKRKFAEGGFAQSYNSISDPDKYLNYGSTPFSQFTQTAMETPAQMARTGPGPLDETQPSFTAQAPALTQGALMNDSDGLDIGNIGDPSGKGTAAGPGAPSSSPGAPGATGPGGFSWGTVGGALGTAASAAMGVGGLGLAGSMLGTAADVANANNTIGYANAQPGLNADKLGFMDYMSALANSMFGLGTSAKDAAFNNAYDAVGNNPAFTGPNFQGPIDEEAAIARDAQERADAKEADEEAANEQEADDAAGGGTSGGSFGGQEGDTGHGESGDGYARGGRAKRPTYMTAGQA